MRRRRHLILNLSATHRHCRNSQPSHLKIRTIAPDASCLTSLSEKLEFGSLARLPLQGNLQFVRVTMGGRGTRPARASYALRRHIPLASSKPSCGDRASTTLQTRATLRRGAPQQRSVVGLDVGLTCDMSPTTRISQVNQDFRKISGGEGRDSNPRYGFPHTAPGGAAP